MDDQIPEASDGRVAATRVRDLIREICGVHDVKIMKGHVSKDHVHLLVSFVGNVLSDDQDDRDDDFKVDG
jgi:hypothetical protein